MFQLNDDLSIYVTRGDSVLFSVSAEQDGEPYVFKAGDLVRITVYGKKNAENVILQKGFPVNEDTEAVEIYLSKDETRIGSLISKPKDYWYEIELNPFTDPHTIIGYDEDGAKIFKLFPEGANVEAYDPPKPEDIPFIDDELDMTSIRPVQNQAVARAVVRLKADVKKNTETLSGLKAELSVERARINNLAKLNEGSTTGDAELADGRVDHTGRTWSNIGEHIRSVNSQLSSEIVATNNKLNSIGKNKILEETPIELEWETGGWYDHIQNGNFTPTSDASYTSFTPSKNEKYIRCIGRLYYRCGALLFMKDSAMLSSSHSDSSDYEYDELLEIPSGCTEIRFSKLNSDNASLSYCKVGLELNVETEVKELKNNLSDGNVLFGKKYVSCGDSFTSGDFLTYVDESGNVGKESNAYDKETSQWKTYSWWIAHRNNMSFINEAKSGSDFTNIDGANQPFSVSRYKEIPTDTDYLTIMFGLNEGWIAENPSQIGSKHDTDNNTLWGAFNVVFEYFFTNMPFMKVGVILADAWLNANYASVVEEICKYWGVPCLNLRSDSVPMLIGGKSYDHSEKARNLRNLAYQMSADDMHPNPKAHEYRSTIIENFMRSL